MDPLFGMVGSVGVGGYFSIFKHLTRLWLVMSCLTQRLEGSKSDQGGKMGQGTY